MGNVYRQARAPPADPATENATGFETWARFSNGIFTPYKEDVMKKHNKNSLNQLTYKTVRSLKTSDEKVPRPLPSGCVGWPQQQ